jgi:hypothetical protein
MTMTPKEFVEAWKKGHIPDSLLMRLGAANPPPEDRKYMIREKDYERRTWNR